MGSGQAGGIITLMDLDTENAAGFLGRSADTTEARYVVYYLSHAVMFCAGALIEAHIVLTPASCALGEMTEFEVMGGSHRFLENYGVPRTVTHVCTHKAFNRTKLLEGGKCLTDNVAILVLESQYKFNDQELNAEFVTARIRYGAPRDNQGLNMKKCRFFGFGSRRNGFLVPLLIHMRKVDIKVLSKDMCEEMWNHDDHYLCLSQFPCKSERLGPLCPDDLGSVIECDGFIRGMMTTRLLDRPCGTGFLDMHMYLKFMTCAVEGARDLIVDLGKLKKVKQITTIHTTENPDDVTPGEEDIDVK